MTSKTRWFETVNEIILSGNLEKSFFNGTERR